MSRFLGSADGQYKSLKGKRVLITGMMLDSSAHLAVPKAPLTCYMSHQIRLSLTGCIELHLQVDQLALARPLQSDLATTELS